MVAGTSPAVLVIRAMGVAVGDAEVADGMVGGASRDSLVVVVVWAHPYHFYAGWWH